MVFDRAFNACCSCCGRRKKTPRENAHLHAAPSTTRQQRKIDRSNASKTRATDSRKLEESSSKSRWYSRSKSRQDLHKKNSKAKMQGDNKPIAPPARTSFASPIVPSASFDDRLLNRQRMSVDVAATAAAAGTRRTSALQDAIRASAGLGATAIPLVPIEVVQTRRPSQPVTTIGVISTAAATSTSNIPPLPSSEAAGRKNSIARKGSTTLRPDMVQPTASVPPPPPPPAPPTPTTIGGLSFPFKRSKSRTKSLKSEVSLSSSITDVNAVALGLAAAEGEESAATEDKDGKKSRSKSIGGKVHDAAGKAAHAAHLDQAAGKVASVTHADKAGKAFKTQVVERINKKKSVTTTGDGKEEKIDEEIETSVSKITKTGDDDISDISRLSEDSGEDDSKLEPPKTGLKKITSTISTYGDAVVDNVTDNPVTNAIDKLLIKLKVKKAKPGEAKTRAERMKRRKRKRRRTRRKKRQTAGATDDPTAPVKRPRFWQKITKRNKAVAKSATDTPPTDGEGDGNNDKKGKQKPADMIKGKLAKASQSVTSMGPMRKLSKKRAKSKQKEDDEKAAAAAAALAAASDATGDNNKTVLLVDEKIDKKSTEELTESQMKLKSRRQTTFSKITGAPSVVQTQTLLVKQKASKVMRRKGSKNPDITTTDDDAPAAADKEKAADGKKSLKDKLQARTPSRLRRKKKKSAADDAAATTDTPATTTDDEATKEDSPKKRGLKFIMRSKSKASRKSGDESTSAAESSAGKAGHLGALGAGAKRSFTKIPGMNKKKATATPTLRVSGEEDGRISTNASTSTRELGILPHLKGMPGKGVGKLLGNKKPGESPSALIQEAQAELIVDKVVVRNSLKADEQRSSAEKSGRKSGGKSESYQSARTGSAEKA